MIPLRTIHEEAHLEAKAQVQLSAHPPAPPTRLWWDIFLYSIILFVVSSLYYVVVDGGYSIQTLNRVSADVSIILIGLSMGLSGLCYFWNFADKYIIYRKELGVIGFAYALFHSGITLARVPLETLLTGDALSFWSAVGAIIIYTIMVLITNTALFSLLGGHRWRILMRWGYIGFILSIIHFTRKDGDMWIAWFLGHSTLFPPFSLFMLLLGVGVIVLRIALFIALIRKPPTP